MLLPSAGEQAAQWGAWAKRAMKKWRDWDATWGREMKIQLFFQTGDLIMRPTNDAFIRHATEGFEAYRAAVEPYTLAYAERETGVPTIGLEPPWPPAERRTDRATQPV